MTDAPYYLQYWNPRVKGEPVKHTTLCQNAREMVQIYRKHPGWEFEVFEMIRLTPEELVEVINDY